MRELKSQREDGETTQILAEQAATIPRAEGTGRIYITRARTWSHWVKLAMAGGCSAGAGNPENGLETANKQANTAASVEASLEAKMRRNTLVCHCPPVFHHWSNLLESQLSRECGKCSCLQCRWHKLFRHPTGRNKEFTCKPWAPGSGSTNTAGLGRSQPGRAVFSLWLECEVLL